HRVAAIAEAGDGQHALFHRVEPECVLDVALVDGRGDEGRQAHFRCREELRLRYMTRIQHNGTIRLGVVAVLPEVPLESGYQDDHHRRIDEPGLLRYEGARQTSSFGVAQFRERFEGVVQGVVVIQAGINAFDISNEQV